MPDDRPTEVLAALPRTRPHRRSQKRAARSVERSAGDQRPAVEDQPAANRKAPAKAVAPAKPEAPAKPARPSRSPRAIKPAAERQAPRATTQVRRPRPERLRQPAQPAGAPKAARPVHRRSGPPSGTEIIGTAVQAAAELAEIGLSISARAVRGAVSRLPRP